MTDAWYSIPLLLAVGAVTGVINIVAGGGSLLTLPLLIFLGLPATVANGTNRVGILVQNVAAVWGFHRHRLLDVRWIPRAAAPATAGAVIGAWAALHIGDRAFERALAAIMVGVVLWTIWGPGRRTGDSDAPPAGPPADGGPVTAALRRPALLLAFFGAGVYAGFVQAGVGFLLLAGATMAGLDLVRGNALKVLVLLVLTPVVLALFAAGGKVAWAPGIALAAGNLAGALLGVRLTVLKGQRWIRRFVTAAILLFAALLWL